MTPKKKLHWHIKFREGDEPVDGVSYVLYKINDDSDWLIYSQGVIRGDTHVFKIYDAGQYKIYAWKQVSNGMVSGTLELTVTPEMIHDPPPEKVDDIMNMVFRSWKDLIEAPTREIEEGEVEDIHPVRKIWREVAGPVYGEPIPIPRPPFAIPVNPPSPPPHFFEKQKKSYVRHEDDVVRITPIRIGDEPKLIHVDPDDVPDDEMPPSDHLAYESIIIAHSLKDISDTLRDTFGDKFKDDKRDDRFIPKIIPDDHNNNLDNEDPLKNDIDFFIKYGTGVVSIEGAYATFYDHKLRRKVTKTVPIVERPLIELIEKWRVEGRLNQTQYINAKKEMWDVIMLVVNEVPSPPIEAGTVGRGIISGGIS